MSDEEPIEVEKLKSKVSILERSLQVLTHYMRHDPGWDVAIKIQTERMTDRIRANSNLSEAQKLEAYDEVAQIQRMLRPHVIDP